MSCRLKASDFPVHLLSDIAEPGSVAGRTSHVWCEIPKGTPVGVALGDLQASVYSCMAQRTDAGKFFVPGLLTPVPPKSQLCASVGFTLELIVL